MQGGGSAKEEKKGEGSDNFLKGSLVLRQILGASSSPFLSLVN